MGGRLTEEEPKQTSPTPYGDIFDEALPQYLAIGMPYDLYWDGEAGSKKAFRKAYGIRIEQEQRLADQNNWYMGQYLIEALSAVPLLVAGLNVKRTTNLPKYPDKPFFEKAEEQKKEDLRRKKEEDQQRMAMAMFQAMAMEFNKKHFKAGDKKPEPDGTGQ